MISSLYQRKRTSETDKRGCFVCYKPTNVVLLNENPSADFFYVCESHLSDRGFCKADSPPPVPEAQTQLDDQIRDLKKEWDSMKRPVPPVPPKPDQDSGAKEQTSSESNTDKADTDSGTEKPGNNASNVETAAKVPQQVWFTLDPQIHKLRVQHKARLAKQRKTAKILQSPLPQTPTHVPK